MVDKKAHSKMLTKNKALWLITFDSALGWFGILGTGEAVIELTFGHGTADSARKALSEELFIKAVRLKRLPVLAKRLMAYAQGKVKDEFFDIPVEFSGYSEFQSKIYAVCRKIRFGKTISYGNLAEKAGFPRAARAVGNAMAANKVPIIVPCHRVVQASGALGAYSALGGVWMKKRLLEMENFR